MKKRTLPLWLILIFTIIGIILFLFVFFQGWKLYHMNQPQVPVLMYHQVMPKKLISKNMTDVITTEDFEKQLKYLKENGYSSISLDQFYCWKKKTCQIPEKSVLLTFDDGFSSVYHFARPLLRKYGFQISSFLIGSTLAEKTIPYGVHDYNIMGKDIITKKDDVITYASHSYNMHRLIDGKPKIYSMSYYEMIEDIEKNKQYIQGDYMTYPYNTDIKAMRKALKNQKMKLAFRGENEFATRSSSDYQVSRIGVGTNFDRFRSIFETKKYWNRYGNGLIRKVAVSINRKFHITV